MAKKIGNKFGKISEAVKATQIAFEIEYQVSLRIKELAAREGLTTSDQIRKIIGLPYSHPKRPRLTVSLNDEDYKILAKKYDMDVLDLLGIKYKIMEELLKVTKE